VHSWVWAIDQQQFAFRSKTEDDIVQERERPKLNMARRRTTLPPTPLFHHCSCRWPQAGERSLFLLKKECIAYHGCLSFAYLVHYQLWPAS